MSRFFLTIVFGIGLLGFLILSVFFTNHNLYKHNFNNFSIQTLNSYNIHSLDERPVSGLTLGTGKLIIGSGGEMLWYFDQNTGELFRKNIDRLFEKPVKLSLPEKHVPDKIFWEPHGSDFIIQSGDKKIYYNAEQSNFQIYPPGIKYIRWIPDTTRVIYIWSDDQGTMLISANGDLSGSRVERELDHPDLKVAASSQLNSFVLYGQDQPFILWRGDDMIKISDSANIENVIYSPQGTKIAYTESLDTTTVLKLFEIKNGRDVVVDSLFNSSTFAWNWGGEYLIWFNNRGSLKRINLENNSIQELLFNPSLYMKEIIAGRFDKEIIFTDFERKPNLFILP